MDEDVSEEPISATQSYRNVTLFFQGGNVMSKTMLWETAVYLRERWMEIARGEGDPIFVVPGDVTTLQEQFVRLDMVVSVLFEKAAAWKLPPQ